MAEPAGGATRAEAGEDGDWCDSGLGSLGEGQLSLIQEGLAVTSDPCPPTPDPAGGPERPDSALGAAEEEGGGALGAVTRGLGSVRVADPPPGQGPPEAWLRHVLRFVTEDGDTALHLAVIHEHEAFLDSILQYTAGTEYLDLQNDLSQTALHIAVILGASNFVRKLMAAGAGLCVQEKGGHTALHLACREGWRDCAQWLLASLSMRRSCEGSDARAQLDCTNYDGYTPLHVAVLRKDLEAVKLLELSCGRSPLHLAVESQSPEVVEYLLHAGADPGARMYVGYTPIYSAMHRPNQKILQLLREFGSEEPDWDSEDSSDDSSDGCGVFSIAGNVQIQIGAPPNICCSSHRSERRPVVWPVSHRRSVDRCCLFWL
ncbi:NF-kappa-B inhibitor beta isoform X2 [Pelodiscus sinensis]|uniref:NF-kappa-B inhibitor beta isoform X2 n=1 Tax=Pelodiscus sinensis TaxID=13735 RepID=UPI003F6C9325